MADTPGPDTQGDGPAQVTHSQYRSIFRRSALQHNRESQERIVFPRFTTPRALRLLWLVAGAFVILGMFALTGLLFPL